MKNIALVDFTEESIRALEYAVEFTKLTKGELEMVNVSAPGDYANAYKGLEKLQKRYSTPEFEVNFQELAGEFEHELTAFVNHEKVGFVFSGTHNMSFLERVLSSRALKLLNHIPANFVFIPPSLKAYKPIERVLIPVFTDKHSLQNLEALRYLNHFMNFEFVLCASKEKSLDLNNTVLVAKKILDNSGIPFSIETIGNTEDEFRRMVTDIANIKKADMISIVNLTEEHTFNFGAKGFVEALIRNNEGLPILVIQNHKTEHYSGFHTTGGY